MSTAVAVSSQACLRSQQQALPTAAIRQQPTRHLKPSPLAWRRDHREARYDVWREFDPEDTMRFYALRMNEVGFIEAGPNKIIANGTDWRLLNEIKRELKT
ncbi:hypothetical protein [Mesorhizobium abyssinicae]|uniref:hypothetical protein n=1 Tax=Mesorhizobium abyssinicae TaxID=1209958 RepID=UPI00339AC274